MTEINGHGEISKVTGKQPVNEAKQSTPKKVADGSGQTSNGISANVGQALVENIDSALPPATLAALAKANSDPSLVAGRSFAQKVFGSQANLAQSAAKATLQNWKAA